MTLWLPAEPTYIHFEEKYIYDNKAPIGELSFGCTQFRDLISLLQRPEKIDPLCIISKHWKVILSNIHLNW